MSRDKGGRRLNAQERALWDKVVRDATPLPKRTATPAEPTPAKRPGGADPKDTTRLPRDFRIGQSPSPFRPPRESGPPLPDGFGPARMDRKAHGRMVRGKLVPEARIDLHGMTLEAAHRQLTRFILTTQAEGRRLVLVITGKGRGGDAGGPIPVRTGVLRHQVPQWLRSGPLASAVLDIAPAHRRHGGSGAYYVYLRRRR